MSIARQGILNKAGYSTSRQKQLNYLKLSLYTATIAMKALCLLVLCLVLQLLVRAQMPWAPDGAIWHYKYSGMCLYGYTKITVEGDTLIQDIPCRRLRVVTTAANGCQNHACCFTVNDWFEYTYADNDRVYRWNGSSFVPHFDFSLEVGDTYTLEPMLDCEEGTVVVTETGSIELNGHNLRYYDIAMQSDPNYTSFQGGRIIERMGVIGQGFLFNQAGCMIDIGGMSPFRCYKDDEFGQYTEFNDACEFILSVDETATLAKITVYPNPVQDVLRVEYSAGSFSYLLLGLHGAVISTGIAQSNQTIINMENLASGVYTLVIESMDGARIVRRVVKSQGPF